MLTVDTSVSRSWHPDAVTRARLSLTAGIVLLITACLLPCGTLAEWSGASLPYQDPTPAMLDNQADGVAALERALVIYLLISGFLSLVGLCMAAYGLRRWRKLRREGASVTPLREPR